jgi:hypothetical protein
MLESLDFSKFSMFKKNNREYCEEKFSGAISCDVLRSISSSTTFNGFTTVESRLKLISRSSGGSIAVAGNDSIKNPQKLIESLAELARLRQATSNSKRLGFMSRKHDLWDSLMPQFGRMKEFLLDVKRNNVGAVLELSKSLHDVSYLEYELSIATNIRSFLIAFTTDGLQDGLVGIELIGPSGAIILNRVVALNGVDLSLPVEFAVDHVLASSSTVYRLRVFARAAHPVYMFEFVKYRYAGLKRIPVSPFAEVLAI